MPKVKARAKVKVEEDYIKNIKDPIYLRLRKKKGYLNEGEIMYLDLIELEAHPVLGPKYQDDMDKILHRGKYSQAKKMGNKSEE